MAFCPYTHAQETVTAFPFKKSGVIGSNSAESFPGHQQANTQPETSPG